MSGPSVTIRLLIADEGAFHHEEVQVPAEALERYDRLIDLLQEEPAFLRQGYIDLDRLCLAQVRTTE